MRVFLDDGLAVFTGNTIRAVHPDYWVHNLGESTADVPLAVALAILGLGSEVPDHAPWQFSATVLLRWGCAPTVVACEVTRCSDAVMASDVAFLRRMAKEPSPATSADVRRACFGRRGTSVPRTTSFAKGTCRVATPSGAVARQGSSESSEVVFLDHFARPISAFRAVSDGPDTWPEEIELPDKIKPERVSPLGQSTLDRVFGGTA